MDLLGKDHVQNRILDDDVGLELQRLERVVGQFVNEIFIPEEWQENFRISRTSLLKLSELLRPFI